MAEKHKSKYKKPENKKPTYRKDLKDYTLDDKEGKLNPKSAGETMPNLLRKTDKEMQDDGKMYPTYNADDRLYKDLEDGEYDPKTALKRMKKRQDAEEKDVLDDKIQNLTREQKERLVREYIRRKIAKVISERALAEQPAEDEDPNAAPVDAAAEPVDAAAAPVDAAAEPVDAAPVDPSAAAPAAVGAAAIGAAATPPTETPPTDPAAAPAPTTEPEATEPGPEERQTLNVSKVKDVLSSERSNLSRIEILFKAIDQTFEDADPIDIKNFYRLMLRTIAKHYKKIDAEPKQEK
jgi:hypothetical protein